MDVSEIIGVVLCGGESSRMGLDKGAINYHGIAQRDYVHSLLLAHCSLAVFSTGNKLEDLEIAFPDREEYAGHGPISGLLSIHQAFPDKYLLVLACDYPLVQEKHLTTLLKDAEHFDAICYGSGSPVRPEPLIALYHPNFLSQMDEVFLHSKQDSLRKYLERANTKIVEMDNPIHFISADRPEDASRVRQLIQDGSPSFEA